PELAGGGLRFGQILGHIVLVEKYLALKIIRFDEIAIDEAKVAHAGPAQRIGEHGAERSAATQSHMALQEALLAFLADAEKTHLATVAIEIHICIHSSASFSSPSPAMPNSVKNVSKKRRSCSGQLSCLA